MATLKELLKRGRYITKINGEVYDITDFIPIHPGGNIIKGIANGNDGTAMFYSSHFNLPDIESTYGVKKIELNDDNIITSPLNFNYNEQSFYFKLKTDIRNYFEDNYIDYRVPSSFARLCFTINISLFLYFYYLSYVQGCITFSILMGILSWNFAGVLTHDHGAHGTNCDRHNIVGNFIMSLLNSLCFPGAFETHFIHSHHAHHAMVHDPELDSDENLLYPLVRLNEKHKRLWFHKYQHLYWPFAFMVYLFSYIGQTFAKKKHNWWRRHNHLYRPSVSLKFKILVLSFVVFHLMIPVYNNGLFIGIIAYLLFLFTYSMGGLFFAIVSHYIGRRKEFIHPNEKYWDFHTVNKSGDYMVNSLLTHYVSGGFNVHGLHHLFPTIHPSHLGSIYPLYEKRCKEFNYPYINIKSWRELIKIYLYSLYRLGNTDGVK